MWTIIYKVFKSVTEDIMLIVDVFMTILIFVVILIFWIVIGTIPVGLICFTRWSILTKGNGYISIDDLFWIPGVISGYTISSIFMLTVWYKEIEKFLKDKSIQEKINLENIKSSSISTAKVGALSEPDQSIGAVSVITKT